MSHFTKTLIVDASHATVVGQYYKTIKEATDYLYSNSLPGTIIVEQGIYIIDGSTNDGDKRTVEIPSNVTIIGRGNVEVLIQADISAFRNKGQTENPPTSNTNIKIYGFKIVVDENLYDYNHVINLWNVSSCHLKDILITRNPEINWAVEGTVFAIRFYTNLAAGCSNNIIEGCRIYEFGCLTPSGYEMGGGIFISKDIENPTYPIKNFIIKNNIISHVKMSGFEIDDAENTIISGNIVFDLVGEATVGLTTNAQKYILKGNIFNNCGVHAYYPSGASKAAVFGNIFINNLWTGVHLRYAPGPVDTEYHALTGNICIGNGLVGILAQNGTNYCSFYGGQYNENDELGIRIQYESPSVDPPVLDRPPKKNLVAGNVAVNNDNVQNIDISVSEYDKQIVANNIGRVNA